VEEVEEEEEVEFTATTAEELATTEEDEAQDDPDLEPLLPLEAEELLTNRDTSSARNCITVASRLLKYPSAARSEIAVSACPQAVRPLPESTSDGEKALERAPMRLLSSCEDLS
jgi:hypothetical protein